MKLTLPVWTIAAPVVAWVLLLLKDWSSGSIFTFFLIIALIAAVLASVHHAEVVAHRVGEPFGTLILAIAVTVLELSLIVTLMYAGGEGSLTLARDTVLAANMVILTGIIGLCILVGSAKYHEQFVVKHSATSALIALSSILVLTLILPNYTTSAAGPVYNSTQLIFVAIVCLILYAGFILVQSIRHREYFVVDDSDLSAEKNYPNKKTTIVSFLLLIVCLGVVVLLAKALSPTLEVGITSIGAPKSLVGIVIATVILLPEGIAAIQAARRNKLQTSINLALGSALASTGLTIPAVAVFSLYDKSVIMLGIDAKSTLLLLLSIFTVMLSLVTGKTNILYGIVLLVIFITFIFTTIIP